MAADLDVGRGPLHQPDIELDQAGTGAELGLDGLVLAACLSVDGEGHLSAIRRVGADDKLAALGHRQRAEGFGASAHRLAAVGKHDGGHAGIDRRRHPGVEPQQRRRRGGGGRERRVDPRPRIAAGGDYRDDERDEEKRADGIGVLAVGARRRPRRFQLGDEAGETLAMQRPKLGGLGLRRGAERVLVGRGRAVLDVGAALQAPHRLGAGGERQPHQRQEGDDQRKPEDAKQDAVYERRHQAPAAEQREHQEGGDHDEGPQQSLPDALAEQRKPAQAHAGLEAPLERVRLGGFLRGGSGAGRSCHNQPYLAQAGPAQGLHHGNLGVEAGEREAPRAR